MHSGRLFVGTSGWSYRHWAKGRFYPKGMKSGEWLGYYAERFATAEVNSTFYRLPRRSMLEKWRERTGDHFRFAIKLWRRVTHHKKLNACGGELEDFLDRIRTLGPKRGPLLVQLPPSQGLDVEKMRAFLEELDAAMGQDRLAVTVEFRHPGWLCREAYELLAEYGVATCLADLPTCPIREPNEAPFVYVRRHGPGGDYRWDCGAGESRGEAEDVGQWLKRGRDVYVYYNNDIEGYAVDNARQLAEAVGG